MILFLFLLYLLIYIVGFIFCVYTSYETEGAVTGETLIFSSVFGAIFPYVILEGLFEAFTKTRFLKK